MNLTRFAAAFCAASMLATFAQTSSAHPADENPALSLPETTREFRQDRYGIFIRWGLYSQLCEGEAVMKDRNIPAADYEKLATFFNPTDFDAKEWVAMAKSAGLRYIIFSAKTRDGFAMWNAKSSDWNLVNRTPFGKDILRDLLDECRQQGVKLVLSYSPIDWHYAQTVQARQNTEMVVPETSRGEKVPSMEHCKAQLTELLTRYGPIDGVRLEPWDNTPEADAQLQELFALVHHLQPSTLIGTSHGGEVMENQDVQVQAGGIPNPDQLDPMAEQEYRKTPLEIGDTINRSTAFNLTDNQYQSARDLLHNLVRAAGSDANYALNVGAMPNGKLQKEFTDRLYTVGLWLAKHGDSIFDTRGGPTTPQPWGVTTHRGRRIYVHVLDPETTAVQMKMPTKFRTARYMSDDSDVKFEKTSDTLTLNLRKERRGELERIVVVETQEYHAAPMAVDDIPVFNDDTQNQ